MRLKKCVGQSAGNLKLPEPLLDTPTLHGMVLRKKTHEALVLNNNLVPGTFFILSHEVCTVLIFALRKFIAVSDKELFSPEELNNLSNKVLKLVNNFSAELKIHPFKRIEEEKNLPALVYCIEATLAKLPKVAKELKIYGSSGKNISTPNKSATPKTTVSRDSLIDEVYHLILANDRLTNKDVEEELRIRHPSMSSVVPSLISAAYHKYPDLREIRKGSDGKRPRSSKNDGMSAFLE